MKLNEIVSNRDDDLEELVKFMKGIKKTCPNAYQTLIKEKSVFFRGINDLRGDFGRMPIRTDRIPLDTSLVYTKIFNLGFEKEFGVKNIRNKSLYFKSKLPLQGYGTECMIFLKDDAKISYSLRVEDYFDKSIDIQKIFGKDDYRIINYFLEKVFSEEDIKNSNSYKDFYNLYQSDVNYKDALASRLKDFYEHGVKSYDDLKKPKFDLLKKMIDYLWEKEINWGVGYKIYHKTSDVLPLKISNEIFAFDSSEYFFIEVKHLYDLLDVDAGDQDELLEQFSIFLKQQID